MLFIKRSASAWPSAIENEISCGNQYRMYIMNVKYVMLNVSCLKLERKISGLQWKLASLERFSWVILSHQPKINHSFSATDI